MTGPRVPGQSDADWLAQRRGAPRPSLTVPTTRVSAEVDESDAEWLTRSRRAQDKRLGLAVSKGREIGADESARVLRLQMRTGLPEDVISRNLDQVEREAERADFNPAAFRSAAPGLTVWMAESPLHAGLAQPDAVRLAGVEQLIRGVADARPKSGFFRNLGKGLGSGLSQAATGLGNVIEALGEAPDQRTPQGVAFSRMFRSAGGHLREAGREAREFYQPRVSSYQDVDGGSDVRDYVAFQLGQSLGSMGAVVAATALGGPVGGIAASGTLAYGDIREEMAELGPEADRMKNLVALGLAIPVAALDAITPTDIAAKLVARGAAKELVAEAAEHGLTRRVAAEVIKGAAKDAGIEAGTEAAQELIQYVGTRGAAGVSMQGGDLATRVIDAAIGGALGGGLMGGTSSAVKARRAEQHRAAFEAIGQGIAESELLTRMPEKLQEVVERFTKDGPAEFVYTPVETWNEYFQSKNIDPGAVAEELLGNREAYDEALRTGGDIAIPTARYAVKLAPTEHGAFFLDEIRASPLELNVRETREILAKVDAPDKATGEGATESGKSASQVASTVSDQLVAAGFDQHTADSYASVYEAAFRTLGQRAGVDPLQLFERYGLEIQRAAEAPTAGPPIERLPDEQLDDEEKALSEIFGGSDDIAPAELVRPRTASGQLKNLEKATIDEIGNEYKILVDANAAENTAPSSIDTEYAQRWVGMKEGAAKAKGRVVAREKTIAKLEAEMERRGIDLAEAYQLADERARNLDPTAFEFNQSAYHGSPHVFDRFSLDKLGTGAGHQAYGWGLYFSSEREIAELYRSLNGRLYKVEIPEADTFLDYEKPFNEQSQGVRSALERLREQYRRTEGREGAVFSDTDTGGQIYVEIGRMMGTERDERGTITKFAVNKEGASRHLASLGINGIRFLDGRNYVVFDDRLIDIIEYQQRAGDEARGRLRFQEGRTAFSLELFRTADLSTFLHETGHFYLEVLRDLALAENASPQIQDDYATLLGWLEVDSWEDIGTKGHEQFARAFEAYLMEGKAPTSALRRVFARFRAWLISVYREMRRLDVELTPEVRSVMDRLLATDEEIAAAEAEQGMRPLFADPAAVGMKPSEAEAYAVAVQDAQHAAEDALSAKLIADVQREQKAWWKTEREKIQAEIAAQTDQEPVYIALSVLQRGTMPDGSALPGWLQPVKLSRTAIVEGYGAEAVQRLPRPLVYARDGGIHPDVAAEMFGFPSGGELLTALANAEPRRPHIERLTDERMREQFGNILLDGRLPVEAMKAVHTEKRAQLLRKELEHLASNDLATLKGLVRRITRRVPSLEAVRRQAEETIGRKAVREINPLLYQRAEARAARQAVDALLRGDIEAAFEEKQRELLNHELYRAAAEARDVVEGTLDNVRKVFGRDERIAKSRDMDLVNAARAIAAAYGLGRVDAQPGTYLEPTLNYDPDTYTTVKALVDDATMGATAYRDATFDSFVAMRDAIDTLWRLARRSKQIEIDGRVMDRDEVQTDLAARLAAIAKPGERAGYTRAVSQWDKAKLGLMGMRAALRRVESWVDAIDGGDPNGVFRRYIWNPISEGTAAYRVEKKTVLSRYLEIVKAVDPSLTAAEIAAPEIGYRFSGKGELLGALLHTGNESNLDKLLRGRNWNPAQWDAFVRRMWSEGVLTKLDYDYAQAVWDLFDELKAGSQRAHRQMYGHYFAEVTASAFDTPFGSYRGGYVPAKADPFIVADAAIRQEREAIEKGNNSFMFPTAGRGFTKRRTQQYAAPLMMDLRYVPSHIDAVLRFVHIEPRVKDVGRIVLNREFRAALDAFDPTVGGDMLVPWLQRAAQQTVSTPSKGWGGRAADTFFRELRTRTGLQVMTANVTNALQQFTGFSIAAVKVRPKYLRNALWTYTRRPKQLAADVTELSTFMRTRVTAQAMEIQTAIDDLLLNPSKYEQARAFAQRHGYFLQQGTQNVVDLVVWSGAYDQATTDGATQVDAVRQADAAVRLTQGSFAAEDVSRFETGTPFVRAFTMFYSYFNMQANLLGSEFTTVMRDLGLKKGAGRLLYMYVFGFMIPAVLAETVVRAMAGEGWDDDDDGYLDDLLGLFFGSQMRTATAFFPLVGPAVLSGVNAFNDKWYDDRISTSPAVSMLESAVRAPYSVYKAITDDGSQKRATRDLLTFLGLATGLPLTPIARPVGYLMDVDEGNAEPDGALDMVRGLVTGRTGTQ